MGKSIRKALLEGQFKVGVFICIPHPASVEVVGTSGVDCIVIDAEHAPIDRGCMTDLIRAADAVGVSSLVRVPQGKSWIETALDSGAGGILVPHVNTAEEAAAVVSAARYPPAGGRGIGAPRATAHGFNIPSYLAQANDDVLVAIMIETPEGVANIEEIAAVDGVDLIFIGPGDLSVSMYASLERRPELEEAFDRVINVCAAANRKVGTFAPDGAAAARWRERGLPFVMLGADVFALGQALRAQLASL